MNPSNLYETLGVARDASEAEIRRAFRKKASENHPDKGGDGERMTAINLAYECLSDPDRRARYDETGEAGAFLSIYEKARGLVMEAFSKAMAAGIERGFVENAKTTIEFVREQHQDRARQIQRARDAFRRKRAQVRTKKRGAINVFHLYVDDQIAKMEQAIAATEEPIAVCEEALKLLDEHESEPAETSGVTVTKLGTSSTWTTI